MNFFPGISDALSINEHKCFCCLLAERDLSHLSRKKYKQHLSRKKYKQLLVDMTQTEGNKPSRIVYGTGSLLIRDCKNSLDNMKKYCETEVFLPFFPEIIFIKCFLGGIIIL